jgi:hypothetical protein
MIFWSGVLVSVLYFVVRYEPVTRWLKGKYPRIASRHFEIAIPVVFALGLVLTIIGYLGNVRKSRALSQQITRLQTTVQQVEATADILVTGQWVSGEGPSGWLDGPQKRGVIVLIGQDGQSETRLLPTDKIGFSREADNLTKVHYVTEAEAGGTAIGGLISDFEKCAAVALTPIILVPGAETKDRSVSVSRAIVDLWVNRSLHYHIEKTLDPPAVVPNSEWFIVDLREHGLHDYRVEHAAGVLGARRKR